MDWGRNYTASWSVHRVHAATWAESDRLARISSASVERTRDGLLESGSLEAVMDVGAEFEPGYYRIVLVAEQDGMRTREEIATLYCASTGSEVERGREVVSIEGRSVLYPASVRRLLAGTYAPKGVDGAQYAAEMLRGCLAAPIDVSGGFTLSEHVVFELGRTALEAARAILDAGNHIMQVDGHGTVRIMPKPSEPAIELSNANARLLLPKVSRKLDLTGVPNVYLARDGGMQAVAVNDDPASPTSTVARGYEHDVTDSAPRPVDGESLAEYARRKLAEASVVEDAVTYTREWWPGVHPGSLARCSLPGWGIEGDLRVVKQSLTLGMGVTVLEQASKEVRTWQA